MDIPFKKYIKSSNDILTHKTKLIVLFLILILSLSLRIYGISWGLPNDNHMYSYHPDEIVIPFAISNMDPYSFDFNPNFFIYPTFYIYIVAFAYGIASFIGWLPLVPDKIYYVEHVFEFSKMFLIGRGISVVFGVLSVLLVYLIAKRLYNEKVALLSALFLAIAPLHILDSHFMRLDIAMVFWVLLSLYFSSRILKSAEIKWYILAGLSAGLAASTKYFGIISIFSIITAHIIRDSKIKGKINLLINKKIVISFLVAFLGFFLTSPYIFLDFGSYYPEISFVSQLTKNGWFGSDLNVTGLIYHRYIYQFFATFPFSLGIPLSVLAIIGWFYSLKKRDNSALFLNSFFIPYLLYIGSWIAVNPSYFLPILPILCIFAAIFAIRITNKKKFNKTYILSYALLFLVVLYTFLFSFSLNNSFMFETRDLANEWIDNHIPQNTTILTTEYGPPIDKRRYNILNLVEAEKDKPWQSDSVYTINETFINKNPEYIIISSRDYIKYYRAFNNRDNYTIRYYNVDFDEPNLDKKYKVFMKTIFNNPYKKLRDEELSYTLIKVFDYNYLDNNIYVKLDPRFNSYLASPTIEIYKIS